MDVTFEIWEVKYNKAYSLEQIFVIDPKKFAI